MYALYDKTVDGEKLSFRFMEKVSLFGCNRGHIPRFLRARISATQSEPFQWDIRLEEALEKEGKKGLTFVIDLKPNNIAPNLSYYEVVRVWGVSAFGWSPIMFQLRMLFGDDNPARVADGRFTLTKADIDEPIFSLMYLNGSVSDGRLVGKWTTPGRSSTNSVLLWPETFDYFSGEMAKVRDDLERHRD
ncbi:hypothetical protein [uncultured Enterovirga sp.]|uniref:hypothetical protein n=1 Tax=uncultured Enterovirga sp. TaxID=2026352 RepID=UPI0035CA191A